MPFRLLFPPLPEKQLADLKRKNPKKHRKVLRCLGILESDPEHAGLNSHRYEEFENLNGEKIWESSVENKTSSAYRVFWHFGPDEGEITVIAITLHP